MNTLNNKHRAYTGVDKFHAAGYFGQRVTAATGEYWNLDEYNPDGLVFDPLNIHNTGSGAYSHPAQTAAAFFEVAPKARLAMLYSNQGRYGSGDDYDNLFLSQSTEAVEQYGITNMFVSMSAPRHRKYFSDLSAWLQAHGTFKYFWAAGNDDDDAYNPMMEVPEITGVAAYHVNDDGSVNPASYSSVSEYVDFAAPSGIWVRASNDPSANSVYASGTSFATPWLCGMACLVDDFFIDKTGRPLSREAMVRFFRDHTVDIGAPGFDEKTGYGAVVLPDPAEIDVWKYQIKEEDENMDTNKYNDDNQISSWAKNDVYSCKILGIMQGDNNNNFNPKNNITREEIACALIRLYNLLNKG